MPIHIDPAAAGGWPTGWPAWPPDMKLISRRAFVQALGGALVAGFTAIAGGFLDWLTRTCLLGPAPRLAATG